MYQFDVQKSENLTFQLLRKRIVIFAHYFVPQFKTRYINYTAGTKTILENALQQ